MDLPGGYLLVRRADEHSITVMDRQLTVSFLLAPDQLVEHWTPTDAGALVAEDAHPLLALHPEVVILGTGPRQKFPPAAFMSEFLRRGVGIEAMDNAAAARTYGLLASEGRRVLAGFILPAGEPPAAIHELPGR